MSYEPIAREFEITYCTSKNVCDIAVAKGVGRLVVSFGLDKLYSMSSNHIEVITSCHHR